MTSIIPRTRPPLSLLMMLWLSLVLMLADLNSTAQASDAAGHGPDVHTDGASKRIIGYFPAWGVYGRQYFVKNIVTSGSADKLTHINYAFGNVVNGRCAIGDSYADYDQFYDASRSVDGNPDTWDGRPLRGSFNQLRKLKALYPNLKVIISLGGWTWSGGFSAAAATEASRRNFATSCIELFIHGRLPNGVSAAGVFDGIDIDWEYPAACGRQCGRPEDTRNFTLMLAEFRRQLDDLGRQDGRPYLLTIAAPAGPDKYSRIELDQIHTSLDFINLMTYDFHGAWENVTNLHSPLYGTPDDPSYASGYWSDHAVTDYLAAGIPSDKVLLGVPFYGRGWSNVPDINNGLYQRAGGPAPGRFEQGVEDYKILKNLEATYGTFWHPEAQAFWIYSPATRIFWSYDNPSSMVNKMNYVSAMGLGGAMFWELTGDDETGSLISAIANTLQ